MAKKARALERKYLSGPKVTPIRFEGKRTVTVKDLVEGWAGTGAFNGGRLAEAAGIYKRMIEEGTTIALTLSGAMVPAGMGGLVADLMRAGFVDFIISTGANLYHDLHFALDLPARQGDFQVDDEELAEAGIERIYDVFITEEILRAADAFVQQAASQIPDERPVSTARVHAELGKRLIAEGKGAADSILATAAALEVPIFCSSPGDSSIGMNLAAMKVRGGRLLVDTDLDIVESSAIVSAAKTNGVIEVGGGSPKNFYMQTQPMLWQILDVNKGGHDYFIQITTDSPQWGGLSGATPREAISWGKIARGSSRRYTVVYCDATIAVPIIAGYALSTCKKRKVRRLYGELPKLRERLEEMVRGAARRKGAPKKKSTGGCPGRGR